MSTVICRDTARLVCLATMAAVASCQSAPPAATDSASARVLALMECQECNQGEQAAVLRLGALAVPALNRALDGPDTHRLGVVERSLREYTRPTPPESAIQYQLGSFRSMYRQRASKALQVIGGADAHAALCRIRLNTTLPSVDRAVVDSALAYVGGVCP